MSDKNQWISVKQAAVRLGIKPGTVRYHCRAHHLRAILIEGGGNGGVWRIDPDSLHGVRLYRPR